MYIRLAKRLFIGGLLTLSAMIAVGAASWACVPGGGSSASGRKLAVDPAEVMPGESVTVATSLSAGAPPVEVRLNSAKGTLLTVLEAGAGGPVQATFNVPPETPPGRHALIALQQGARWEPVLLAVAGPDGVVPDRELSDAGVNDDNQPWGPGLVGLAAVVVIAAAVTVSRRRRSRARPPAPALEDSAAQDSVQHPTPAP
ncbi:MAG: hypothetical protein ACLGI2_07760 [Acidimicrobiia bacterium]